MFPRRKTGYKYFKVPTKDSATTPPCIPARSLPKADNAAGADFVGAEDKAREGIGSHNVRVAVHMVEDGVVLGRSEVEVAEFVEEGCPRVLLLTDG